MSTVGHGAVVPPPPPDSAGPDTAGGWPRLSYTVRSAIQRFNFGSNGETNGVLLQNGTLALLPPELATQVLSSGRVGTTVSIAGTARQGVDGRTVVDVQTITVRGRVIGSAPPPVAP